MVTKLGGTVDDSELVHGAVFDHKAAKAAGGPTRVENAKIALVQFHISPPKTDLENNVIISDYQQARSLARCQCHCCHMQRTPCNYVSPVIRSIGFEAVSSPHAMAMRA